MLSAPIVPRSCCTPVLTVLCLVAGGGACQWRRQQSKGLRSHRASGQWRSGGCGKPGVWRLSIRICGQSQVHACGCMLACNTIISPQQLLMNSNYWADWNLNAPALVAQVQCICCIVRLCMAAFCNPRMPTSSLRAGGGRRK